MRSPTPPITCGPRVRGRILIGILLATSVVGLNAGPLRASAAALASTPAITTSVPGAGGAIVEGVDPGADLPADATGSGNQLDPAATAIFSQVQIWPVLLVLDMLALGGFVLLIRRRRSGRQLS